MGMAMKAAATKRGRWFQAVVLALCVAAAAGAAAAGERLVYRLELPGARVLYSESPAVGAGRVERPAVDPHSADAQEALPAQRTLAAQREALLRASQVRSERPKRIDAEISRASEGLQRQIHGRRRTRRSKGRSATVPPHAGILAADDLTRERALLQ